LDLLEEVVGPSAKVQSWLL